MEALLSRLGIGSVRDEAWAALNNFKKGSKDIVELAGEAEKLAKRLHPRDEEAAERHAVNAFLGALERPLAAEVQKLGHRTMEEVVAAARRIGKILEEQTDSKMERLVNTMQDQIRNLKKDLKEAHEEIAAHKTTATRLTLWRLSLLPQLQPLNRLRLSPLPLATSTRNILRNPHFTVRYADRWIDDPPAASSAERKDISSPTVRLVQSSSASSTNKCVPALAARLEDKSWSYLSPRTTPRLTPTYS